MGIQLPLQVFEYEDYRPARTIEIDREIHFHTGYVCSILEYSNDKDVLSRYAGEKGVVKHNTLKIK